MPKVARHGWVPNTQQTDLRAFDEKIETSVADSISSIPVIAPRQGGSNEAMVEDWGRATPGRPPISSGERHHAVNSRPVGAVSRRSRHKTRPCNIRASGTAKVGTMTRG